MLREVENIYEKRKEIQRPLHVCLTQYFLENKMKEHKQVLQDFVRLPSDLKKHIQTFYKSTQMPKRCGNPRCPFTVYEDKLTFCYYEKYDEPYNTYHRICVDCKTIEDFKKRITIP